MQGTRAPWRTLQEHELHIFVVGILRVVDRQHQSVPTIEETELQQIRAHEGEQPVGDRLRQARAPAARMHVARAAARVAVELLEDVVHIGVTEVVQALGEVADRAVDRHVSMQKIIRESRLRAPAEPQGVVGSPAAVVHHLAAELRPARDAVAVVRTGPDRRPDLGLQLGRDALVGVEREHPVARGERKAARHLRAVARPVGDDDARSRGARDRRGLVGAARIEHQHLVGEGGAGDAVGDPRGLVLGDDDHRKRIVRVHVVSGRGRGSAILAAA